MEHIDKVEGTFGKHDNKDFIAEEVSPAVIRRLPRYHRYLGELLREVDSREETVLPGGLRRLVDSVYFSINSKYKRASVDKILRLYETMQTLRSCNDLDAELSAKKAALSASEASELSVIDKEISEMKEQRINSYVTALVQRVTAS